MPFKISILKKRKVKEERKLKGKKEEGKKGKKEERNKMALNFTQKCKKLKSLNFLP